MNFFLFYLSHITRRLDRIHRKFDLLYDINYPLSGKYMKRLEKKAEKLTLKKTMLMRKLKYKYSDELKPHPEKLIPKIIYK